MSDAGLGRRISPDNAIGLGRKAPPDRSQDHEYLMPRRTLAAFKTTWRYWSTGTPLDQDGTSQCVAYAGYKYLTAGPVLNRRPKEQPEDIYRECLKVDEWPGEDWDGGTSVRALFKVLQERGYVSGYQWAFDVNPVMAHVLTTGPVVMGTNYYRSMFTPDRHGYVQPTGPIDGGHAWLIYGGDIMRKNPDGTIGAARWINSWGGNWGPDHGRAWITLKDLDRLIREDGEACTAKEIKISALEASIAAA